MTAPHPEDLPTEEELDQLERMAAEHDGRHLMSHSNILRLVRAARRGMSPHTGLAALGDGTYLAFARDVRGLEGWEARGGYESEDSPWVPCTNVSRVNREIVQVRPIPRRWTVDNTSNFGKLSYVYSPDHQTVITCVTNGEHDRETAERVARLLNDDTPAE